MKAYIAGPLCTQKERQFLEEIDKLCKEIGIKTFLPHRDCGLWKKIEDTKKIAKGDIEAFKNCDILIANLNGFNIGAGTAWEIGYAYAKRIPVIALKTDRNPENSIEDISAIIYGTTKIVTSMDKLKVELIKLVKGLS